ncbi:MAG: rhodanese-like domain-containing protein [Paracoccaceae bacterium]
MKRLVLALIVALASTSPLAARTFGPLVTPTEIQAAEAARPIVLDTRGPAYDQGHIPGAISAPYGLFRGPAENPGALVPVDELQSRLRALGLTTDRPVVIVHQGKDDSDFGSAARVYWTLKSTGFTDLSILNGGMNAWLAAGLPLETEKVVPTPSDITISFSDEWLATTDEVERIVDGQEAAHLIDARPPAFFEGKQAHEAAARPGTLPGAENLPHSQFFVGGSPAIGGVSTAKDVAAKLGLKQGEEVVSFCNTGHWAATDWFALSELAGVPGVKLYPDSMVGYSQTGKPMENTPGLWQNLKRQIGGN